MSYDVIIVGGRIAGSALAILLGRVGARVLVLERSTFSAAPISAPLIFANALSILKALGVHQAVEERATRIYFDDIVSDMVRVRAGVPAYQGVDYHLGLRREILDAILLKHAATYPTVEIVTGCTVTSVLKHGSQVIGVAGRVAKGDIHNFYAPMVVGADGKYSVVGRSVGAEMYNARPGRTFNYYCHYATFPTSTAATLYIQGSCCIRVHAVDSSLTAVVLQDHAMNWVQFKHNLQQEFEARWKAIPELQERGTHAQPQHVVKGCGPQASFYRRAFGEGWVLIGDAGYHKDPCTGQGVYDALRAAELVLVAWQAWQGGMPWHQAMQIYSVARDRETKHMYDLTHRLTGRQRSNLVKWAWGTFANDPALVTKMAGVFNGATPPETALTTRTYLRFFAQMLLPKRQNRGARA